MKRGVSKFIMVAAALLLSAGMTIVAYGATGGMNRSVSVVAGKAETVALPTAAADILVANPGVADVGSLRADRLYVVGRNVGDTNILAFDAQGQQIADIAVTVGVDDDTLRKTLKELFPRERIDARTVGNNVVLKGRVSTPMVANQVRDIATRFVGTGATNRTVVDLMTVRGEQQVMLKVKVLEVKRDLLREMGVDLDIGQLFGNGTSVASSVSTTPGFGISATQFGSGTLSLNPSGPLGPIDINLQGLETDGVVSTLAEPTLTAISGETAGFLAGGEFPVPAGRDTSGNVSIEFRQFGVSLSFVPTVLSEDHISLQLTSEVSERSDTDGIPLLGTLIPGLAVRRAQTTVQMSSGGTIMIAGLLRSRTTQGLNGVPGLKDLPVIGELFKSRSFQRGESELVFLVTPFLVEPFADQQAEQVTRNDDDLLHSILQTPGKGATGSVTAPATMPASNRIQRRILDKSVPVIDREPIQPVKPRKAYYQRQGEESRTAGAKKADAAPVKQGSYVEKLREQLAQQSPEPELIGAPVVDVEPAPVMPPDHPALTLPVGKKKVSFNDSGLLEGMGAAIPLPRRSPGAEGKRLAAAAPKLPPASVLAIAEKAQQLALMEPKAGEPAQEPEVKAAAPAKVATLTIPLPHRKPVQTERTSALSGTFMNSLKKIYGNKVTAKLGEGQSYGYIVD